MERITRRLSMHKTPCLKCKEYKSCNTNLIQIIQEQNKQIDNLKDRLHQQLHQKLQLQQQLRRGDHERSSHDSPQPIGKLKKTVQGTDHP